MSTAVAHRMMTGMSRYNIIFVSSLFVFTLLATACTQQKVPTARVAEKAHFAFWSGYWSEAKEGYAELTYRSPDNWKYQYRLGVACLNLDELDSARRALEIAETLRPQQHDIAVELAETMYRQDDRTALFTFLVDRAESTQKSSDWLLLARYSLDLDDPDMARLAIQEALVLDTSDSPKPYLVAAELAERLGDIDGALQSLKIAWTLDPENTQVQAMIRGLGEVPGPTMLERTEMGG